MEFGLALYCVLTMDVVVLIILCVAMDVCVIDACVIMVTPLLGVFAAIEFLSGFVLCVNNPLDAFWCIICCDGCMHVCVQWMCVSFTQNHFDHYIWQSVACSRSQ